MPLIEFELDESITDEEAQKLIEEPISTDDGSVLIEDQLTLATNEADLFTARLMRYEVKYIGFILSFYLFMYFMN